MKNNMTIEILYSELTNIYGDVGNIRILEKNLKDAKFIYTKINEEPHFVKNKVDMIYMGSMPEEYVEIILKALKKHTKRLKELIEKDTVMLFTGTAFELCGDYIIENDKKQETLGLINNIYFKRDKDKRHNSLFIGNFNDIKIVGNKSQFCYTYGENKYPFIEADPRCMGMNEETKKEGIHYKNFFGTQVLGPILILNPLFLKYLLKLLKHNDKLYLEDLMMEAYNNRLKELENPDKRFILKDHG